MTNNFYPYICERCKKPTTRKGLCWKCIDKCPHSGARKKLAKHRSDSSEDWEHEPSPWRENAVRDMEDQA